LITRYLRTQVGDKVEWSILRGGYFMNNILHSFSETIRTSNTIYFPEVHYPAVDTRDIGRCAAVLSLEESNKFHGKAFECSGPEMLSPALVAETLSRVLKTDIKHVPIDLQSLSQKAKLPPPVTQLIEYMIEEQESAIPFKPDDMGSLLGEPPTSFERWAKDHAALFLK
jgi:uncharacterized protein YbjT (DUF2867 family)